MHPSRNKNEFMFSYNLLAKKIIKMFNEFEYMFNKIENIT